MHVHRCDQSLFAGARGKPVLRGSHTRSSRKFAAFSNDHAAARTVRVLAYLGDAPLALVLYAAFVARVPREGRGTALASTVAKVAWVGRIAAMVFGLAVVLALIVIPTT